MSLRRPTAFNAKFNVALSIVLGCWWLGYLIVYWLGFAGFVSLPLHWVFAISFGGYMAPFLFGFVPFLLAVTSAEYAAELLPVARRLAHVQMVAFVLMLLAFVVISWARQSYL